MQAKAVRFLEDVADDPDKADDFAAMTPEEYAEHKHIRISNRRRNKMPRTALAELQETIDDQAETISSVSELVEEALDPELTREEIVAKLKEISELVEGEEDEDDD